ncbi:MAG: DoxX family rane protein [Nocardioides sp.]|nr:DoxX family rane protein [Nocardioides sp.]
MPHWLASVACLVVGPLFIVSGISKALRPGSTVRAAQAYDLLPTGVVRFTFPLLPYIEVLVGAMLLLGTP